MGQKNPITQSFNLPNGQEVTIETGKLATQADGSVVVRMGDTMLFCSVVSSTRMREGQSFFPLSVDYQEKFAAAGRIPGNFFRRETRLSDYEILISRLVDRVCRPLFPDGYMFDTQIIINLISADKNHMPDALAALAASAALTLSDIPFDGPISECRVARINGQFVVNPNRDELENADLDIIVGASASDVMMVEGEMKEVSEAELVEAIKVGHEAIKVQCEAQNALADKVGRKETRPFEGPEENEEILAAVKSKISDRVAEITRAALNKSDRKAQFTELKESMNESLIADNSEEWMEENGEFVSRYYKKVQKAVIRKVLLDDNVRLDGRKPEDVRDIWTEVDYLPSTHGSAIFTRGETQALTTLTLGTKLDEKMEDNALNHRFERFILHYNFPAYSVGETKPMRGPGRREVGHANLAGRSLKQVMPEEFPYTIRLVSDIMESNGSSSMATVCAGSMAMMDGGVPLRSAVSGIAMGMVRDEDGRAAILSDILGDEDALGDMDFKVTGTEKGICGCQMDIKIDGLPYELLEKALNQARDGRVHILNEMAKTLGNPEGDLKPHAPRIVKLIIDKSYIGAVIGPGGSVIQEIQRETETVINLEEIDDKGHVTISSSNKDSLDAATARIKQIAFQPEVGEEFEGKVASVQPYGVFVEFAPGKSGLVHISELSWSRIEKIEDAGLKQGDPIKVKLIGIDERSGKMRLSRKVLLEKPTA